MCSLGARENQKVQSQSEQTCDIESFMITCTILVTPYFNYSITVNGHQNPSLIIKALINKAACKPIKLQPPPSDSSLAPDRADPCSRTKKALKKTVHNPNGPKYLYGGYLPNHNDCSYYRNPTFYYLGI